MAWIKVFQSVRDHRKILDASHDLKIPPAHMIGLLVSFWLWALDNAPSGSLANIRNHIIAAAAQWDGDPDAFVSAMARAGLLCSTPEGLEINDWYEYTGKLIDQREAEKNRGRRRRAAAAAAADSVQETSDGRPADVQKKSDGREEKSRVDKSREDKSREEETREDPQAADAAPTFEQTPYKAIITLYHELCPSYQKLRTVNDKRKKAISARWKEHGQNLEVFKELFIKAEASLFLKGKNPRNWAADFNWLLNSENMAKVLEGKYDNEKGGQPHEEQRREGTENEPTLSGFRMADV